MNSSQNWSIGDPLAVDLGTYTINGSGGAGTAIDGQRRLFKFAAIQFQFITAVIGAPVITFDISTDNVNWRQCTFAESQNTANVNSVATPALGYIGIVTIKPLWWRLRVVGAGSTVTIKVTGLN